jgi:hypothetical protein
VDEGVKEKLTNKLTTTDELTDDALTETLVVGDDDVTTMEAVVIRDSGITHQVC